MRAASNGHSDTVKVLLEAGADIEAKGRVSKRILHTHTYTYTYTYTHVHMDILLLTLSFASIEAPASSNTLTVSE